MNNGQWAAASMAMQFQICSPKKIIMKFRLLYSVLVFHLISASNQQILSETIPIGPSTLSSTPSVTTTTTLSPWDQAYIEVFGHLPSEFQNSITPTFQETTTTFPIIIDGASPDLTYQLKNGTIITLGNLTNVERPPFSTQAPPAQGCRDKARNCEEMRAMCNTNLYSETLADVS